MSGKKVLKLTPEILKGEWEEGSDPMVAFLEIVEKGYDPDGDYAVFSNEEKVCFTGKLLECLTEAARRSSEGYFVVMPVADMEKIPTVGVH